MSVTVEIIYPAVAGMAEYHYGGSLFKVIAPMNTSSVTIRMTADLAAKPQPDQPAQEDKNV